jgi:hypothetical protein
MRDPLVCSLSDYFFTPARSYVMSMRLPFACARSIDDLHHGPTSKAGSGGLSIGGGKRYRRTESPASAGFETGAVNPFGQVGFVPQLCG